MPRTAISGTYEHPGIPGAYVTAGREHVLPWLQQHAERAPWLASDIETFGVGTDALRIKCVTLSTEDHSLVLDPRDPFQAEALRAAYDRVPRIVFHTAPFDVPSLVANDLMADYHVGKVWDTVVYARMAEPGDTIPKRLEDCSARYLGIHSDPIKNTFKVLGLSTRDGFYQMDVDSPAYLYGAAADGIVTARLVPILYRAALDRLTLGHPFTDLQPSAPGWAAAEVEKHQQFNRIMLRRTVAGLRVDLEYLERFREANGKVLAQREDELAQLGIRPGVSADLTKWLQQQNALPPSHPRTAKGALSGQKKHLEALGHPVARKFLEAKETRKVQDDYLVKAVELARPDGHGDLRIHPTVGVLKAAHGRTSMSDPPFQQYPGPARGIVLPDRGDLLASVDWAQQEPVIGLNLAGDVDALYDYETVGKKIYEFVSKVSNQAYKSSKVVLLAGMYGEGMDKLSADLGLDPGPFVERRDRATGEMVTVALNHAAWAIRDAIFGKRDRRTGEETVVGAVSGLGRYIEQLKKQGEHHGLTSTINGRILPIPFGEYKGRRSRQAHKTPNYRISGSAADQFIDTVIEVDRQGLSAGLYAGMHDELVVSHEIMHDVQQIMEIPPEGLIRMAKRVPKIRTDASVLGERWSADA